MHRCRFVGEPGCAALAWASECGGRAALRLRAAAADGSAEAVAPERGTLLLLLSCPALALSKDRSQLAAAVDAGISTLLAAA